MNRLEATRVVVESRATRRSSPASATRVRPVRGGRSAAELLHVGQHGPRVLDRTRPRARRGRTCASFVLDGDGSLLMNLGSLATIGLLQAAATSCVIVWTTRNTRRPAASRRRRHRAPTSMPRRARWGSRRQRPSKRTEANCATAIARAGSGAGPWVIVAKVTESAPTAKPPLDCVFIKQRFMAAIRQPEPATKGAALVTIAAPRRGSSSARPPAAGRARARGARLARHDRRHPRRRGRTGRADRAARHRSTTDRAPAACSARATARVARPNAALANGTAAHALDYDDMCFVSLAHPSAPLVAAALAAAELPARPAARCSTPTSSASRSKAGSDAR